jgi:hypothetical protein
VSGQEQTSVSRGNSGGLTSNALLVSLCFDLEALGVDF